MFKEDLIFEVKPDEIKVRKNLPRLRKKFENIEKLAESIKQHGQIHPVVVNRDLELIAGGRRLAACALAGVKVKCIYRDAVDDLTMRELELEENLQREDLTPAEESKGVEELHRIKQEKYGKATPGVKGGWTLEDTAKLLGKTKGSVIEDLHIAEAVSNYPELAKAKTKSEIKKAYRGIQKLVERTGALEAFQKAVEERKEKHAPEIVCDDAAAHMQSMEDNSVDLLLTDPPYGIAIDEMMISVGGKTGGFSTAGFKFKDDEKKAIELYTLLAKESFRFCKPTAHAFVFTAPDYFWFLRALFRKVGWSVYPKPIIWIKGPSGQTNVPAYWPASCYEMILYARQMDAKLVIEARPDWIQCPRVNESVKRHPTEKPVPLLKELIERTTLPGKLLYDPFMGSGASLEAALETNLFSIGVDIAKECCEAASERVTKWMREHS